MNMPVPSSIAIIPDGNRRFAKKNGLRLEKAYWQGFQKTRDATEWARDAGAKSLTLWALSLDNYVKRSKTELSVLFRLVDRQLKEKEYFKKLCESDVRVKFFGKRELMPNWLQREIGSIEEQTKSNKSFSLNLGLAYSGRDEILNATKKMAEDVKQGILDSATLTESSFENYLYLNDAPDLIFRSGDTHRLSGLMPWQSVYAEIYFCEKLWPEVEKKDFDAALEAYSNSERKFGK